MISNGGKLLSDYPGRFNDGSPAGWDIVRRGEEYIIEVPGGTKFITSQWAEPESWLSLKDSLSVTDVLWADSLLWLPRILERYKDERTVWRLIREYARRRALWGKPERNTRSLDHQIALRLRAYLTLLGMQHGETARGAGWLEERQETEKCILGLIKADSDLVSEYDLFNANNHGIMLGIAMLHVEEILGSPPWHEPTGWAERLYGVLSGLVDRQGLVPENTPQYQGYYILLLDEIVAFLTWSGHSSDVYRRFRLLRQAVIYGYKSLLLPDNSVPPIGDGTGGEQTRYAASTHNLWSPENGITIARGSDWYLSVIAGFKGVIHKQLDDGSICLWHNGRFILRDAGLLGFDWRNANAVRVRTQKGHSSAFYKKFDDWTTDQVISFGANTSRMGGKLLHLSENDSGIEIGCERHLDGRPVTRRLVYWYPSKSKLIVQDQFLDRDLGAALVRFIFDPSISQCEKLGQAITLNGSDISVQLSVETTGTKNEQLNFGTGVVAMPNWKESPTKEVTFEALPSGVGPMTVETTISFRVRSHRSND